MKKRIICVALCIFLLLPVIIISSFAESFGTFETDVNFLQYDYLTANQKAVYDAVIADPYKSEYIVTLPEEFTYDSAYAEWSIEDAYPYIFDVISGGISALSADNPMIFQFDYSFSYLPYPLNCEYETLGTNSYRIHLRQIKFSPKYSTTAYPDLEITNSELKYAIENFKITGFTRYDKVKSMHDKIINLVTYDPNVGQSSESSTNRDATGAFLEPHIVVCEGYAEAFKLLCDRENIPCVIVLGTLAGGKHAWNYVQMDDGKWYAVDLTQDDQTETTYINFLVGSESTDWYSNSTFASSHVVTAKRYTDADYSMTYPELSTESYSKIIPANNSITSFDKANSRIFIMSNSTVEFSFSAPYGWYADTGGYGEEIQFVTGSTMNMMNMFTMESINYKVIIRGDVNASGTADLTDYYLIKKAAAGTIRFEKGSDFEAAADMDGDGAVDAFDAFMLEKYISGRTVYY